MYRTVDSKFWTDPKVRALSPTAKLCFLYLVTNPHSHVGGIYYLPTVTALAETGLRRQEWDRVCDTLSGAGIAKFDILSEVVWVVNMFGYQGRGEKNERAVVANLGNLHNSSLVIEFLRKYPALKRYGIDRVSIGVPAQDQTRTQEQEQDIETPLTPLRGEGESEDGWLARIFHFLQRGRKEDIITVSSQIKELRRLNIGPEFIRAEIERPGRNRSERFFRINDRLEQSRPKNGDPTETAEERFRRTQAAIAAKEKP